MYTAERITEVTTKHIEKSTKLEDKTATLKPEQCTFESVILPLAQDEVELDTVTDPALFMQSVSTEKDVRDAATENSKKLSVSPTKLLDTLPAVESAH